MPPFSDNIQSLGEAFSDEEYLELDSSFDMTLAYFLEGNKFSRHSSHKLSFGKSCVKKKKKNINTELSLWTGCLPFMLVWTLPWSLAPFGCVVVLFVTC